MQADTSPSKAGGTCDLPVLELPGCHPPCLWGPGLQADAPQMGLPSPQRGTSPARKPALVPSVPACPPAWRRTCAEFPGGLCPLSVPHLTLQNGSPSHGAPEASSGESGLAFQGPGLRCRPLRSLAAGCAGSGREHSRGPGSHGLAPPERDLATPTGTRLAGPGAPVRAGTGISVAVPHLRARLPLRRGRSP